jgi:hypothetical protein
MRAGRQWVPLNVATTWRARYRTTGTSFVPFARARFPPIELSRAKPFRPVQGPEPVEGAARLAKRCRGSSHPIPVFLPVLFPMHRDSRQQSVSSTRTSSTRISRAARILMLHGSTLGVLRGELRHWTAHSKPRFPWAEHSKSDFLSGHLTKPGSAPSPAADTCKWSAPPGPSVRARAVCPC